jgi:hypothetical protein
MANPGSISTIHAYVRAVWKHWRFLVLDGVLGLFAAFGSLSPFRTTTQVISRGSTRIVHHPILPVWIWFAAIAVVTVVIQFLAWRDLYRRPLSPEHTDTLRSIASGVEKSLDSSTTLAVYRADDRIDPYVRQMFCDHFPELASALDLWDQLADRDTKASNEMQAWLVKEINDRFPLSEGWKTGMLLERSRTFINSTIAADQVPSPPIVWNLDCIGWMGSILRWTERVEPSSEDERPDTPPEAQELIDSVQSWVVSIGATEKRAAIKSLIDERREWRERLNGLLRPIVHADTLWGRCDACRPSPESRKYREVAKS